MSDAPAPPAERPLRFRGRRHGRRLRPGRQQLVETLLPRLALPDGSDALDPTTLFGRPVDQIWLEVGFGGGEHLARQAAHHPSVGLIGCEPFINGVASLLAHIADGEDPDDLAAHIRIWPDEAAPVMARLPGGSLARVFVLFPDPWPKRRHWGRRFIQSATLDRLAVLMPAGAELRLATDDPGLADWLLWQARCHPAFAWTATSADDWRHRPADWPATRYEQKRLEGPPVFLSFRRQTSTSV